ncbi:transporter substrate-binding protein [Sneathiella sp. P13V-1]|nr:transporter substrate-binding protein [Sneathiella sp. P13V-1]
MPAELRDLDDRLARPYDSVFRVGLLIPMCGSAGLWAPSCISSAQVAVSQLNNAGGICGKAIELVAIDSALEATDPVDEVVNNLIETNRIDAIVGMHISAVRQNLSKIVNQRIPYVYTPLYEGGENTKGIFAIGDTPEKQLGPALEHLSKSQNTKRWALIGNDYVWPRASNSYAKEKLQECGVTIAYEKYLPFGVADMESILVDLESAEADAVLISVVGQDAITFNRAFGEAKMHEKMIRFSCAIEENGLLACGEDNLHELYSASSYFGAISTPANASFREKYYQLHGENAPVLNALGQSTYEGMQFLAGLMKHHENDWKEKDSSCLDSIEFSSVREASRAGDLSKKRPMYLAKADGVTFQIVKTL